MGFLCRPNLLFKDVQSDSATKEVVGQHDYILVVLGALIGSRWSGQCVGHLIGGPGAMLDKDVILPEHGEVPGDPAANLLCMAILGQAVVVCEYFDLVFRSKEEVPPIFQSSHQGQKLSIIDVVISFSGDESLGIVPHRLEFPIGVSL